MVSHFRLPPSPHFVASVAVFCVLCVSVPCKTPCGWSGLPSGWDLDHAWGNSICGWIGMDLALYCRSHISDLSTVRLPSCWNDSRPLFDEWGNALSGRRNQSHSSSHTSHGLCAYNPCCCMEILALQVPVDVDVYRYRPAHEVLIDQSNSIWKGDLHYCFYTTTYIHTIMSPI